MRVEASKLPGNLVPLASNYQESSYVIHNTTSRKAVEEATKQLHKVGIYPLGRFAEWEYYNMDKAIESAMQLADTIEAHYLDDTNQNLTEGQQ